MEVYQKMNAYQFTGTLESMKSILDDIGVKNSDHFDVNTHCIYDDWEDHLDIKSFDVTIQWGREVEETVPKITKFTMKNHDYVVQDAKNNLTVMTEADFKQQFNQ